MIQFDEFEFEAFANVLRDLAVERHDSFRQPFDDVDAANLTSVRELLASLGQRKLHVRVVRKHVSSLTGRGETCCGCGCCVVQPVELGILEGVLLLSEH